jgi:DNA-binding NtrC family response regulator
VDETAARVAQALQPLPGVVVVHSGFAPALRVASFEGGRVGIGRDDPVGSILGDDRLSRHHAEVSFDGGNRCIVRDLGSRNGTFVNGVAVAGDTQTVLGAVVRAGGTVLLLAADVCPLLRTRVAQESGIVRGACTAAAFERAVRAAQSGASLLVSGESGTGKELVARAFHAACPQPLGPFIAVNCATIPEGVAERVLFGAKRGAYSGATADSDGYLQAADGGVLFLDEIGELDLAVQAKLLRTLETQEIFPLGSATPRRVRVRFCFATNRDLRAEAGAGRFRSDLYYRLHDAEIKLAPLRERREEIPWLIASVAQQSGVDAVHAKLVESCLLRTWPGNVRELIREVRHATGEARQADDSVLRCEHLRSDAGANLVAGSGAPKSRPTRETIQEALARAGGNVTAAARALGLHRTQLRRLIGKLGV